MNTVLMTGSIFLYLCMTMTFAHAADRPDTRKKHTPFGLYLTAVEAHQLKQKLTDKAVLVDIRTPGEVMFVGIADDVDVHIPFKLTDYSSWNKEKGQYNMRVNPDFGAQLSQQLNQQKLEEVAIILMCRSGSRSARAARVLHDLGYEKVYSVIDGFEGDKAKTGEQKGRRVVNGWKNAGLPWNYRVREDQLPYNRK